jgi:hypothetical protein
MAPFLHKENRMCNFFSAIAISDGTIRAFPEVTDAHSELIAWLGLEETNAPETRQWCRVEFTPDENLFDLNTWNLRADEDKAPIWWDEKKPTIRKNCENAVRKMFVLDERVVLLGGCWLLGDGAKVGRAIKSRLVAIEGNASVREITDGVVGSIYGSTTVGSIYGSTTVDSIYGSTTVDSIYGSAKVVNIYGSAKAGSIYDSATVDSIYGSATVGSIRGSAKVVNIYGSAKAGSIYDSATVGSIFGSATVDSIRGDAKVFQFNNTH